METLEVLNEKWDKAIDKWKEAMAHADNLACEAQKFEMAIYFHPDTVHEVDEYELMQQTDDEEYYRELYIGDKKVP